MCLSYCAANYVSIIAAFVSLFDGDSVCGSDFSYDVYFICVLSIEGRKAKVQDDRETLTTVTYVASSPPLYFLFLL